MASLAGVAGRLLAVAIAGPSIWAHRPAISEIARPAATGSAAAEVARGRGLAAIGDCASCHTARDGASYNGGRPITTPFGTLDAPNITLDLATGIGRWSRLAFARALREGVGRDGRISNPRYPTIIPLG